MSEIGESMSLILDKTRSIANELARNRCANTVCGFAYVTLLPIKRPKAKGDAVQYYDIVHGVMCEYDETSCYFAAHPLAVTEVCTEASRQAYEALGLPALVDSPDVGLGREAN